MRGTLVYDGSLSFSLRHSAINFICDVENIIHFGIIIAYGSSHGKFWGCFDEQLNRKPETYDHLLYVTVLWCIVLFYNIPYEKLRHEGEFAQGILGEVIMP